MKTLSFNATGAPDKVLTLVEKDIPTAGKHEVLVKVWGSPVNPSDYFFINGTYRYKPEFPHQTAGLEGAGVVEAVGENVNIEKGTLVAFDARRAWAEYVIVHQDALVVLPEDFPPDKAVQFYLNPFTAWGLLEESKAVSGDWLLLTAANSTVARLVIQLAVRREIKVIAAVRDVGAADELKVLGAHTVLNAEATEFSAQIQEVTSGKGINAALDAVGGQTGAKVLQNMAINGRVIIYGLLDKTASEFYNAQLIYKNLFIKGFGIRGFLQSQSTAQRNKMIKVLIEEMAKPAFALPVAGKFSLEQFHDALVANHGHHRKGKIIFKP